jgi:hypothetical protein
MRARRRSSNGLTLEDAVMAKTLLSEAYPSAEE